MVWKQSPSKAACLTGEEQITQTIQEILPIKVIPEYFPALDAPDDDVVKSACRVYSCFPWHEYFLTVLG
jgi:hypothetical protein